MFVAENSVLHNRSSTGKLTLLIVVMMLLIFASCKIEGNGDIVETEISVSPFETIHVSVPGTVNFHQSEDFRVVFSIDSNLAEFVEIFTKDNELVIRHKRESVSPISTVNIYVSNKNVYSTNFVADVYAPTISAVTMSGSGSFKLMDALVVERFTTAISGSGRIEGTIESEQFFATISGSGRIALAGHIETSNIIISGSGSFRGTDFIAQDAVVVVSGSGSARVYVENNLRASISGSGSIRYGGNPIVNSSVSGSGRLVKL